MNSKAQKTSYPYVRVIVYFALLGGALGGALLSVFATLGRFLLGGLVSAFGGILLFFAFALMGTVLGLLPAALCGICLAMRRTDGSRSGLIHAAVYGALFTWVCHTLLSWMFWQSAKTGLFHHSFVYSSILAVLTGAATAWLLAFFVLPLPPQENPE